MADEGLRGGPKQLPTHKQHPHPHPAAPANPTGRQKPGQSRLKFSHWWERPELAGDGPAVFSWLQLPEL